jgi:hypothetical protein
MEDLQILQKTYDMILYSQHALNQFPKFEKHVLAAEIRQTMNNLLTLIITANKKYYKKTTLQEIDVELEKLRTFVRLSKDMKYIDIKKYEVWSKYLAEIGKMLGGWMKAFK